MNDPFSGVRYEVEVIISNDGIKWPELPARFVYRRREVL
jgi:hypothetical protein